MGAYARHRAALGLSGGTTNAVIKAIETGRIVAAIGPDKLIDAEVADAEWVQNTRQVAKPGAGAHGENDSRVASARQAGAIARASLETTRASRAQDDLLISRGFLTPRDEVVPLVVQKAEQMDAKLRSAPRRFAKEWAAKLNVSPGQAMELIRELVEEIRADMRTIGEPDGTES